MLVPGCLAEQVAGRRSRRPVGSGAVKVPGSARHAHGPTLFSIHPNRLAPAERRVIATWGCCVEQALVLEIGWSRSSGVRRRIDTRSAARRHAAEKTRRVHADW